MTKEEILLAIRLIAMGRVNHEEVARLAEFLAADAPAAPVEPAEADKPARKRKS